MESVIAPEVCVFSSISELELWIISLVSSNSVFSSLLIEFEINISSVWKELLSEFSFFSISVEYKLEYSLLDLFSSFSVESDIRLLLSLVSIVELFFISPYVLSVWNSSLFKFERELVIFS